ncbi:hypothetical protein SAMN02745126_03138 [Enhydrobacter aerosaccus]|uniref:Diguanylate cyclase n=1 Tax=Enhydrobacter aerosaccus TaxID=225324 RepID=A0A1T4QCC2_9HYPH|nr:hypothetical protein [Enhydrobacter aerosaccus]SKA01443.1 hypothetical protein SAMN02745126_03138 [Enhydrobacter aerosaccus]
MIPGQLIGQILLYAILPLWLATGFADYLCHRASAIERTSGPRESLMHLLQFSEVGFALLVVLFLEINAAALLVTIACVAVHEATAIWDVRYANATRTVLPVEQHVHGLLENLPFAGLLLIALLHWPSVVQMVHGTGWFDYRLKAEPMPIRVVAVVLGGAIVFGVIPYLEELFRTLRATRRSASAVS